jgi:hypothetical protein
MINNKLILIKAKERVTCNKRAPIPQAAVVQRPTNEDFVT